MGQTLIIIYFILIWILSFLIGIEISKNIHLSYKIWKRKKERKNSNMKKTKREEKIKIKQNIDVTFEEALKKAKIDLGPEKVEEAKKAYNSFIEDFGNKLGKLIVGADFEFNIEQMELITFVLDITGLVEKWFKNKIVKIDKIKEGSEISLLIDKKHIEFVAMNLKDKDIQYIVNIVTLLTEIANIRLKAEVEKINKREEDLKQKASFIHKEIIKGESK